jgi:3-hydroxyacyl-CoA dehydrogenase
MNYTERLENVTVLGAAGKMGSGILLLTAIEMADLKLKPENKERQFVLNAVDVSHEALGGVMQFLKAQAQRAAEKKTVLLRKMYEDRADLIENKEIIDQYVFDVLSIVRPTTVLETAYESSLIFEAIIENPELKVKLLSQINRNSRKQPWFFTNTSSIPIHQLNEEAGLDGRIIGFHFYNPPAVQKLVELIQADATREELVEFAQEYAKKLRKTVVPSSDFAGFVGNGHFMRDALHGISEVEGLTKSMSFVEALYMINKVSQEFLIRPMGIFQLVDYVGLDVCQYIMSVMNPHLDDEDLHSDLLDRFIDMGVKGGQYADGSQKDGFLKYEKGRPTGIFDPDKKDYVPVADVQASCDERLGPLPQGAMPWKAVIGSPDKSDILDAFFKALHNMDTLGAELARRYGKRSLEIAQQLVEDNVAKSEEDVNTVLLTGFYHAYGPINEYFI